MAAILLWIGAAPLLNAQRLSALAPIPEWTSLEPFQETITRETFVRLLETVYAPNGAAHSLVDVGTETAVIKTTLEPVATWTLRFARESGLVKPPPRSWRKPSELGAMEKGKPLLGTKIALDPGHLGGDWAQIEERWFLGSHGGPVTEGDMTLRVAQRLVPMLTELGATVSLARSAPGPTTPLRPEAFRDTARAQLAQRGIVSPAETYSGPDDPARINSVQFESELLFYRISEIRHRAAIVNANLRPDLMVCLHFNAEAWGDPRKPVFVPVNHLHVLINGCYSATELLNDDLRFEMLSKLLGQSFEEELAAAEQVADSLSRATGLPPYEYPRANARRVGRTSYVWARNLLANRLYQMPVIFLEPYVMNNVEVCERVGAGDYEGERMVAGVMRKSIYREYAEGVREGLIAYFTRRAGERKFSGSKGAKADNQGLSQPWESIKKRITP